MLMSSILTLVVLGSYANAFPMGRQFSACCDLSNARLQVPSNQTQLVAPTYAPSYIALGVGTQNYTCNTSSSAYILYGAVAELFDTSCLYGTPAFDSAPTVVYDAWSAAYDLVTPQELITTLGLLPNPTVLGQHYYVPNPVGTGLSPKWDFTSSGATAGNPNAYVIGVKVGDLPSSNSSNIDNLMINGIEGELATEIFRVESNGGQPPSQCSDANITVKYTAQYWFFNSSVSNVDLI
ncbi:hypothetical protein K503DRAFT_772207 [Rhizopogon vinicolor AM-OR11-026]|uniref:Malate dehydrogenase n=1 Tax=Rhizopogon vinicolor AM-OR11-026 TaxID=1314800 RepID=A0A1B7MVZ1_9AGAM|nr:hypothetical protein K503DRAFT_772207 [Rhizopogon vinicolor AM-OR11-026]